MQIGETKRLKKVVLGVRVLPEVQSPECTCGWEDDDGDNVTLTLARDCGIHRPEPVSPPHDTQKKFA